MRDLLQAQKSTYIFKVKHREIVFDAYFLLRYKGQRVIPGENHKKSPAVGSEIFLFMPTKARESQKGIHF